MKGAGGSGLWDLELNEDAELSAEELDDKYNQDGEGEHPYFTRKSWRKVVKHQGTSLGYWAWLKNQLEEELIFKHQRAHKPEKKSKSKRKKL